MLGKSKKNKGTAAVDAEFEAKYTARMERKNIEKFIATADTSVNTLKAKAAEAKLKGLESSYRQLLGQIKVALSRKRQAETFLFQLDAMMEMQSLTKAASGFLGSMNNIMTSLGNLTLDKTAVADSQRTYKETAQKMERQNQMIDGVLAAMDGSIDFYDDGSISDADIEADIQNIISGTIKKEFSSAQAVSPAEDDALRKLFDN